MTSRSDAGYAACRLAYKLNNDIWELIRSGSGATIWPIEDGIGPKLNIQITQMRIGVQRTVLDITVETE